MRRTPLPWLGMLLLAYLLVPVAAFFVRLPGTDWKQAAAPGVGAALWLSVYTASIATLVIVVLGIPLGYLLARSRGRFAHLIGVAVQLPLALPPLISGILLIFVVGPYTRLGRLFGGGLTDSVTGIVLAQVFVAAPFLVIAARSAFAEVDPAAEEVAATLGHGRLARFARVALPGAAGGIRSGVLLSWLRAFGEFGATVVLAYNPNALPVFVYVQFSGSGLPGTTIPVLLTLGAALVVLLLADRRPGGRGLLRRRPSVLPEPVAPTAVAGPLLELSVRAHVGGFRLDVDHRAGARRLAILGPSGAGKSCTLRVIAGLLTPDAGHLRAGGADLLGVPAERRGIGYLPQDSSLLPRMRLADQITFGVGSDPAVAAFWARRLGIDGLLDRYPDQLSGGQRRRAAMARALARQPRILLFDEPFTGLDTPVREELRLLLRTVTRETGLTTVLVTHDPVDAAMLADEVVVMDGGRVLQAGPQREVFARPASPAVARLLGVRNLRPGHVRDGRLVDGDLTVTLAAPVPDGPATWCVRPEDVRIGVSPAPGRAPATGDAGYAGGADAPAVGAVVRDVIHLGAIAEVVAATPAGTELTAHVPALGAPAPGTAVRLTVPPGAVTTWPRGT
ncbi:ATP-binding cassette domain-containing protein [Streptantibioticus silvisoli]|uniref:ATP-binding cassette domain-containing protein n=1 Tax=Streptantibioticus silvisoli TaxID=2705255 RepID=A0ABT6W107_9ACTN|nr:ATP-binding cassette domain-containing protein [Streptantibioticus silvisoli]MDI5964432.1 ATP-binding cassette domain-containing protein [Streptantibioticus silvisoli]